MPCSVIPPQSKYRYTLIDPIPGTQLLETEVSISGASSLPGTTPNPTLRGPQPPPGPPWSSIRTLHHAPLAGCNVILLPAIYAFNLLKTTHYVLFWPPAVPPVQVSFLMQGRAQPIGPLAIRPILHAHDHFNLEARPTWRDLDDDSTLAALGTAIGRLKNPLLFSFFMFTLYKPLIKGTLDGVHRWYHLRANIFSRATTRSKSDTRVAAAFDGERYDASTSKSRALPSSLSSRTLPLSFWTWSWDDASHLFAFGSSVSSAAWCPLSRSWARHAFPHLPIREEGASDLHCTRPRWSRPHEMVLRGVGLSSCQGSSEPVLSIQTGEVGTCPDANERAPPP